MIATDVSLFPGAAMCITVQWNIAIEESSGPHLSPQHGGFLIWRFLKSLVYCTGTQNGVLNIEVCSI